MSWWAVGVTTAMGVKKGMDNEARMDKNDKFRKAAITYSPWTGMGDPGSQQLPGMLESGLGGAATGAMIGSMGAKGATDGGATEATVGGGLGGGAEVAKLEKLKFTPEQMQGVGPYTAMGAQGSAGALGGGLSLGGPTTKNVYGGMTLQDPNNPLLQYMPMK